jgi:hypothetical protein
MTTLDDHKEEMGSGLYDQLVTVVDDADGEVYEVATFSAPDRSVLVAIIDDVATACGAQPPAGLQNPRQ